MEEKTFDFPDETSFVSALKNRVDDVLESCVSCGKCVEVCPMTDAAGVNKNDGVQITSGVLEILRTGRGPDSAQRWAGACSLSGHCINACDYGVNPRFMLSMARIAMAENLLTERERRKNGVGAFASLGKNLKILTQLQLSDADLLRLGQKPTVVEHRSDETRAPPDILFYTGCNVLKTPHIALLCLDILDALDISFVVRGGSSHCCGVLQHRAGDMAVSGRMGMSTIEKFMGVDANEVVSWCPSCQRQFGEITLPTIERATGQRPFDMTPYLIFLKRHAEQLKPLMKKPVSKKVAILRHTGVPGNLEAAEAILKLVPGLEVVNIDLPEAGLMSIFLGALPDNQRAHIRAELQTAATAGLDALVTIYHADHRQICAHEKDWPFEIINVLEIIADSMGISRKDRYKELKKMQDVEAIFADCADLLGQRSLDPELVRSEIENMINDQPLPLEY